ncbi:unnamed protein product [Adineta steineri]|uniref:G-protein coupled receptors family 1 profile domain-containing protein n=1 Tax=Adineta steineri TaxID=433720 RepID=A0A813RGA5_9BILA|nr:unnamed protein product [Adineta steineri]CAF3994626.1 unnamed protein product [Adineta steineri]
MSNETDYNNTQKYNFISQYLTQYVGSSLYVLCLCGTIMNMLTFLQQSFQRRACSLYLWIASFCDFIHLNIGLLSNILHYGFHYHWSNRSIIVCKIKNYLVYVLTIISASLTILAFINRYMMSSRQSSRWKFSNRRISIRCIIAIIFFWVIVSIPIIFCSQYGRHLSYNEQLICSISCRYSYGVIIQIIYVCLFNGFIPPVTMAIFGFLTYCNGRNLHQRSQTKSIRVRRINKQLTSMLIFQSIKSLFTSIPYSIFSCYWIFTLKKSKSLIDEAKENLVSEIVHLLFWSNYTSFLVYMCSSNVFRNQWLKAMKKVLCCRLKKKQTYY